MSKRNSRGFTLIAALLLTVLLSAIAVGLMFTVANEARMGGTDLEGNIAYYSAESGIEDLTYQLSNLYQTNQNPTTTTISALTNSSNWPTALSGSNMTNISYNESITWPTSLPNGSTTCTPPCASWDIVGAGPEQGMVASMIPYTLNVTATRIASVGMVVTDPSMTPTGSSVTLTRTVEVALLPAFEFGVFCAGDCDFFAGPNFNFGGRVHANGNLYLASGATLTFTNNIAAVGQVVLDRLENNHLTSSGYGGNIYAPNASNGCPAAPTAGPGSSGHCAQITLGSWAGGIPASPPNPPNPPAQGGAAVSGWNTGFGGFLINGASGATALNLPFVQSPGSVGAIDIIRRPTPGDTAQLLNSRLYTMAQIRVLLADTEGDLHPDRNPALMGDPDDIQIGSLTTPYPYAQLTAGPYSNTDMSYGMATAGSGNWLSPNTKRVTGCTTSPWPIHGQVTNSSTACQGAWLRVEYCPATASTCVGNPGAWVGITRQWLGYGFGRGYNVPPTAPYQYNASTPACPQYGTGSYPPSSPASANSLGQCYNPISPAILILQQLQNGVAVSAANISSTSTWLPINLYDSREGEPRDTRPSYTFSPSTCSTSGVMNVVELDVGNLWLWLKAAAPYTAGSGALVGTSGTGGGGYILYFSDHRGMLPEPTSHQLTAFYNNIAGVSGLEDVVNSGSATGVPDGNLENAVYYAYSPEDVDDNTYLDNWGEAYLGAGFGLTGAAESQPYYIAGTTNGIPCTGSAGSAEWNMVTGPRHALRLVDGGMDSGGNSYLPHPPAGSTGDGFTIGSEEPVYVWGDYNTGSADPFWPSGAVTTTPHSAAAIIADSVTLLSNPPNGAASPNTSSGWTDLESFLLPYCATSGSPGTGCGSGVGKARNGNTSYYRVAIASGKNVPFPQPSWGAQDFGTDGGMHNFLRYLEDRQAGGVGGGGTVNYVGSLISMYYSQYATGTFKCCNEVYGAPVRNYFFDSLFLNPANLPPGTPMFQDVVSLSYHQSFTPQVQ